MRDVLTILVLGVLLGCSGSGARPPAGAGASRTTIAHVDALGAARLLATDPATVVLDVRTEAEYRAGHIDGAILVDFKHADFATRVAELDRDKRYLVLCRSGRRSTHALPTFAELGFAHVVHLDGGMLAWEKAGQKVVDPAGSR